MMRLIHWRDRARAVVARYKNQYARYDLNHRFPHGKTVADNLNFLEGINPETASLDDYGHMRQWVAQQCDECGKECGVLVRLGAEPDYEARWLDLCGDCLAEAVALIAAKPPQEPAA